jgi:hypothetical protein
MFPDDYARLQSSGIGIDDIAKSTAGLNRALGFEPLGPSKAREAKAAFEEAVGRIAARDKISRLAAMSKARAENVDLFKALQGE